jgi:shikimate 5-dehydrogenase
MKTCFVVTLPAAAAGDPAAFARRAQAAGAGLLELRGDLTPGLAPFDSPLPLLLAPRGGDLTRLAARGAAWLDLERGERGPPCPGAERLGSFHDPAGCPDAATLIEIGRALRLEGASALKLVVRPDCAADWLELERARAPLAALGPTTLLAMGPLADGSRLFSPWRNPFTYAALEPGLESAPGQWTLAEHLALAGPEPPALTGLLGGAEFTAKSLSPRIHGLLARRRGLRSVYLRFPSREAGPDLAALLALGLRGLSVTAPHKLAAAAAAASLDAAAREAGAVNTLVRDERPGGAVWRGLQLDAEGLRRGYADWRGAESLALLGSGGAAAAVLLAARELDWRGATIFARSAEPAAALAQRFGARARPLAELPSSRADLLVSSLPVDPPEPLGPPGSGLPQPLGPDPRAIDLRYGAATGFQRAAADRGFRVRDGLAMLLHQALAQFEQFHGVQTDAADLAALEAELAEFRRPNGSNARPDHRP